MQIRSMGQIVLDIKRAYDWYAALGISPVGTRLQEIHNYVMYQLLNAATPEAKALEAGTGDEDTYYALIDGAGFGQIATEISKLPSHLLPRRTLRDVLKGPLAASEEESGPTADPRNKFVELELAAHLSSGGFKLIGFDDLEFEFEGHRYLVECKRPSHEGKLDDNIEKAYSQLRKKLDGPSSRGIVAVAVEKVFSLNNRFVMVETPSSVSALAVAIAQQFRDKVAKYESHWLDPRVVGVLAIIRFLMKTKAPEFIGSSYTCGLVKLASAEVLQATESNRLDRMIEKLRDKFLEA
jgi:hypothetical protein